MENERRLMRLVIDPLALAYTMRTGTQWRVENGIPVDAEFRGANENIYARTINIFFSHPHFAHVEIGREVPEIIAHFKTIYGGSDTPIEAP